MQYISTYPQLSLKWEKRRKGRILIRMRSIDIFSKSIQSIYFLIIFLSYNIFILLACLRSMFKLITKLVQPYAVIASERKFIILFGAPGVGKSTYTKLLSNDLGFYHLSIENLICNALGFNKK